MSSELLYSTEGSDCVVSVRGICSLMLNLFTRRVTAAIVTITLNLVMSALVLLLFLEHTLVQCVGDNSQDYLNFVYWLAQPDV